MVVIWGHGRHVPQEKIKVLAYSIPMLLGKMEFFGAVRRFRARVCLSQGKSWFLSTSWGIILTSAGVCPSAG